MSATEDPVVPAVAPDAAAIAAPAVAVSVPAAAPAPAPVSVPVAGVALPVPSVVAAAVPVPGDIDLGGDSSAANRGRGRPSKQKGMCTRPGCNEPEMCSGLCRRCYHQDYNQRKKTDVKDKDGSRDGDSRSAKRQRRRSVSKGPFTTADNQQIDTPYIVEVALNARTKCQVCKQKITREELRIGVLRSKSSATTPGLCRWYHPRCFDPPPDFSLRRLYGRKKLGHADRASLKHILSSPKKHKHHSRDHVKERDRSRSHSRGSDLRKRKKHRTQKDSSKHRPHKKDVQPQIYQNDSSDSSSSYSEVDDFDDEEPEESYESSDSSGDSSASDDDYAYRRG